MIANTRTGPGRWCSSTFVFYGIVTKTLCKTEITRFKIETVSLLREVVIRSRRVDVYFQFSVFNLKTDYYKK